MQRLMEDRALVRQLSLEARRSYEENFTIDRLGREFRALVAKTIAARSSSSPVSAS
jgi:hypothetical protein